MRGLFSTVAALALSWGAATAGVAAGVEARCLVLKDLQTGKHYNLLLKGAGPEIGMVIETTGTLYEGISVCMQGIPVQVASWTPKDPMKCSRSKAHGQ